MTHTRHAWDEWHSGQSSSSFSLRDVRRPSRAAVATAAQPCVRGGASGRLRPREDAVMTNICCISLINASSCHSMPLKCAWPLPQSVQHIAAYGDFTVHSQPTANISQFRSEKMPSVKNKKKADHCCAGILFFSGKNWRNILNDIWKINK